MRSRAAGPTHPLGRLLGRAAAAVVVVAPSVSTAEARAGLTRIGARADRCRLVRLDGDGSGPGPGPSGAPAVGGTPRPEEESDLLVLVVRDRIELRSVSAACPPHWSAPGLACVLLDGVDPPLTAGRPQWPAVRELVSASAPLCFTSVELADRLPLTAFVADLARRSVPGALMSAGAPVLGFGRDTAGLWSAGDPTAVVGTPAEVLDVTADYPPDVVVLPASPPFAADRAPDGSSHSAERSDVGRSSVEHHVLGRLTDAVRVAPAPCWRDYDRDPAAGDRQLAAGFPGLALGGIDDQLVNPCGYIRYTDGPQSTLEPVPGSPGLLRLALTEGELTVDTRVGLRETQLPALRALRGVHVSWRGGVGPVELCRVVAALAQAGVPLTCDPAPSWARALLHPVLLGLVEAAHRDDLADAIRREVSSIRVRRAAYAHHGSGAWRRALARLTGSPVDARPLVSVLLATRRPEMLDFALRQVTRQRGVDLELVLATHGHRPDPGVLEAAVGGSVLRVVPVTADGDLPFGTLLNRAAGQASGDVLLKMDDDDWYGPDFVSDLLMAREQSRADVTGAAAEFAYVEPLDVTVRRRDASEAYRPIVAGGTMLVSRDAFAAVGGFRPLRRHVDAQLLHAVGVAGGTVYRAHGHNYLLRRGASGHTWDPGTGYFVSRARTRDQWPGFRPSALLEHDSTGEGPAPAPVGAAAATDGRV